MNPITTFLNIAKRTLGEDSTNKLEHSLSPYLIADSESIAYTAINSVLNNIFVTAAASPKTDKVKLLNIKSKMTLDQVPEDFFQAIEDFFKYLREVEVF